MSTINISDLNPVGYDLFSDSESYMKELSEDELGTAIYGGVTPTSPPVAVGIALVYLSTIIVSAANSNPKSPHKPPK